MPLSQSGSGCNPKNCLVVYMEIDMDLNTKEMNFSLSSSLSIVMSLLPFTLVLGAGNEFLFIYIYIFWGTCLIIQVEKVMDAVKKGLVETHGNE